MSWEWLRREDCRDSRGNGRDGDDDDDDYVEVDGGRKGGEAERDRYDCDVI